MLLQVPAPVAARAVRGRAERLPFASGSMAMVYSVDVIHHIGNRAAAAAEAYRVLRPGGVYAIVTDSEGDLARRVPLARYFPETVAAERRRYPPIGWLREENAAAGFSGFEEHHTLTRRQLTDIQPYREKAYSSLHLIPPDAFARGIAALEADLARGPIEAESHYTALISRR
jgi:SAM-dependent methyltransferase